MSTCNKKYNNCDSRFKKISSLLVNTFVSGRGWRCPARASFTVVSQMWGSCSPRAVTMNCTGSDRLATSCSAYTVPSGLTLKLGSLLTKPTSRLRWQSSNFTAETKRKMERQVQNEKAAQGRFNSIRCSQILDTSGRLKIKPHPSRRISKYLILLLSLLIPPLWHLWQNKLLISSWTGVHGKERNAFSHNSFPKLHTNVKTVFSSGPWGKLEEMA